MPNIFEIDRICNEIEEYRQGIKTALINDQSENRKRQSSELLKIINSIAIDAQLGHPLKGAQQIIESVRNIKLDCSESSAFGIKRMGSKLGRLAERLELAIQNYDKSTPKEPKYSHIQCIAFFTRIDAKQKQTLFGENGSMAKNFVYAGNSDDAKDIKRKVDRFIAGMQTAKSMADGSSNVLKIMMGPEFFLRGAKGAYSIDDVATILEQLRKETSKEEYKDWIFIPGTAIASLDDALGNGKEVYNIALIQQGGFSRPDGSHEALVYKEYVSAIDFLSTGVGHKFRDPMSSHYRKAVLDGKVETLLATQGSRDTFSSLEGLLANFCSFMSPDPAQRARLANDVVIDDASQSRGLEAINALLSTRFTLANIRTSYREIATRVSDSYKNKPIIDQFNEFLKDIKTKASPDDAFKGFDPNIDYRGPVAEEGHHSLAGGTIFSMAGVRFGLEVCLDHAEKRLRTSIDNSGGKQKPVDVQLIPSAGMTIILDAVATRKNGIVFNVDGYRPIDLASVSAAVAMKVFHPPLTVIKHARHASVGFSGKDSIVTFPRQKLP